MYGSCEQNQLKRFNPDMVRTNGSEKLFPTSSTQESTASSSLRSRSSRSFTRAVVTDTTDASIASGSDETKDTEDREEVTRGWGRSSTQPQQMDILDTEPRKQNPDEEEAHGESSSEIQISEAASRPQHETGEGNVLRPIIADDATVAVRNRQILLHRLADASIGGRLTLINLSRRGLGANDAILLKRTIMENQQLSVLKLGYNDLGDDGAATIAEGFARDGGHHMSLSVLEVGFNNIGDQGCAAIATQALTGNKTIRTVYLSGNSIGEAGVLSLAGAIINGCDMTCLHLQANRIGPGGILALARAVAEKDAISNVQVQQDTKVYESLITQHYAKPPTVDELHLGDTAMASEGFTAISSLILTNTSIRVLNLSHNSIDDQGMALLSQALTRNKMVPLEAIRLSFNAITCVGVECFMNAIWGSTTLRELQLDNNLIRDRGAQLAAVGLTSISLDTLDVGFNKISTLGIKALMKTLSETSSLKSLSLCGIPLDPNACKAVKYALAYNSSLHSIFLDSCQIGYAAQRHVVAGIVSNRKAKLRFLSGFEVGAITVTLGMPQVLENWTNDQALRFICIMWEHARSQVPHTLSSPQLQGKPKSAPAAREMQPAPEDLGPAPPATVVQVARKALAIIGDTSGGTLQTEPHEREISESSPFVPANATLLERSQSGTVRVPPIVTTSDTLNPSEVVELWTEPGSEKKSGQPHLGAISGTVADPVRRQRNLQWLRSHYRSLNEVAKLPFNNADLWQLHQYFFSPVGSEEERREATDSPLTASSSDEHPEEKFTLQMMKKAPPRHSRTPQPSPCPTDASKKSQLGRTVSFQMLGEAAVAAGVTNHKRQSWLMLEDEEKNDSSSDEHGPASKRAKNFKPRIAYYPRIRQKLETLGTKPSQDQTLSLLRLLKFVENVMFEDRNVYLDSDTIRDPDLPSTADVEMIILDLL